jgi:hypothetical protein
MDTHDEQSFICFKDSKVHCETPTTGEALGSSLLPPSSSSSPSSFPSSLLPPPS